MKDSHQIPNASGGSADGTGSALDNLQKYRIHPGSFDCVALEDAREIIVNCGECKFWTEEEAGWGSCRQVKVTYHIRCLGGVWWPQSTFGCIHGERRDKPNAAAQAVPCENQRSNPDK
jgi:hypothetical protein